MREVVTQDLVKFVHVVEEEDIGPHHHQKKQMLDQVDLVVEVDQVVLPLEELV